MAQAPINVLLVESDPQLAAKIGSQLRGERRLNIKLAATLGDALRAMARMQFDVVLLDIDLPDAKGIATVRRLQEINADTPIVLLSGLGGDDAEIACEAMRLGAQDLLSKVHLEGVTLHRSLLFAMARKDHERDQVKHVNYDKLTGLPSGSLLEERFDRAVQRLMRGGNATALMVVRPMGLEVMASEFGAVLAEELLISIASRLREKLRKNDTLARRNYYDFVVLIEGMRKESDLSRVAERTLGYFDEPFLAGSATHTIGAAIGALHWRPGVDSLASFADAAEEAMLTQLSKGAGWTLGNLAIDRGHEAAGARGDLAGRKDAARALV